MKKIIIALIISLLAFPMLWASEHEFADETIRYKVMYKWGLINKQAGTVAISLKNDDDKYYSQLEAASASWADRLYKVRDTLRSEIYKKGLIPTIYEKKAHEGDEYTSDCVTYTRDGVNVIGHCKHKKYKKDKLKREQELDIEAIGTSLDMLTSYYYMRSLPYDTWEPGQTVTINIFSGRRKELLTIKYHGTESIEFDGKRYDCYAITFMFTSDGKTKSSDDMFAWIDTTTRIPVKLEGKLPVGSVKCFYIP